MLKFVSLSYCNCHPFLVSFSSFLNRIFVSYTVAFKPNPYTSSLPFLRLYHFLCSHRLAKIDGDRIERWSKLESKVESFLDVRTMDKLAAWMTDGLTGWLILRLCLIWLRCIPDINICSTNTILFIFHTLWLNSIF